MGLNDERWCGSLSYLPLRSALFNPYTLIKYPILIIFSCLFPYLLGASKLQLFLKYMSNKKTFIFSNLTHLSFSISDPFSYIYNLHEGCLDFRVNKSIPSGRLISVRNAKESSINVYLYIWQIMHHLGRF